KDELRTAIWHERRVEFGMEYNRFYDLKRQGRGIDRLSCAAGCTAPRTLGTALKRRTRCRLRRRCLRLRFFDGQIDSALVINIDNFDGDLLTFRKKVLDIVDIGVGDLRDVHHSRFALRQCDKSTKLGDSRNFAL
ncbi:MAG: RagB/SusD family nutrient uptake outer membrane protein, partial [Clostridia bacterium]|nr:RagB/SusD family nutrient uptake outer membrane protein [Clostridia bacterium]